MITNSNPFLPFPQCYLSSLLIYLPFLPFWYFLVYELVKFLGAQPVILLQLSIFIESKIL